jgi:septal ring factor EnvC (AmiA/AmiB activator)
MTNLQELRERLIALKIERTDTSAELTELNSRLKTRLPQPEFRKLERRRSELASDGATIDGEISKLNARILAAGDLERAREHRLNNLRTIAASITANRPDVPAPMVVLLAMTLEEELQRAVPPVEVADLAEPDEESIAY